MYSYKTPRKKRFFSRDSILWMSFVSIISFALLVFGLYLFYKSSLYQGDLQEVESSNEVLSKSVIEYEKELKILTMQKILVDEVKKSNTLLKSSIKNLFDLVPDHIVLTKVVMHKDLLDLEGTTPTKDTYRLLLEPPLKSIFNSSKVNFRFDGFIGKYVFKSINSMGEEKEIVSGKE